MNKFATNCSRRRRSRGSSCSPRSLTCWTQCSSLTIIWTCLKLIISIFYIGKVRAGLAGEGDTPVTHFPRSCSVIICQLYERAGKCLESFLSLSLSQLLFTHRRLWHAQKGSQPCDPFSQASIWLTEKWVATVCCIYMRQASRQMQMQLLLPLPPLSLSLHKMIWWTSCAHNIILPRCGTPRLRYKLSKLCPKCSKLWNLIS